MQLYLFNIFLLLLLLCFYLSISTVFGLNSDGVALLSLSKHWTSVPASISSSWNASDSTPCQWVGIECDNDHNVVGLKLSAYGISGELGPQVGSFRHLQALHLSVNNFSGKIPKELVNCSLLEYLDLFVNGFSGEIPESLFAIPALAYFSGVIPSSIGNCSKLQELVLGNNQLTGELPKSLNNLENLVDLDVAVNSLEGSIPLGSGNCTKLNSLDLSDNKFSGGLPSGLGNCRNLTDFSAEASKSKAILVFDNNLTGELPLVMTEMKQLNYISLHNNLFFGVIPQTLGIHSNLSVLDFTNNNFTGKIPPNLCHGKQLRKLILGSNRLQGIIPSDVGTCSSLSRLSLDQNNLIGVLPQFAKNPTLSYMDISSNEITGEIPPSLGNCSNLKSINLCRNKLTGVLPQELGNLAELRSLNISENNLVGPLPPQLSKCTKMYKFDVRSNLLNGSIPSSLRSWTDLSTLILSDNSFTGGPIPPELGKLKRLQQLDISHNNLTGTLEAPGYMSSLIEVDVSDNNFTGAVPETLMKLLNSSPLSFLGNPYICVSYFPSCGSTCARNNSFKLCNSQSSNRKGISILQIVLTALGSSLVVVSVVYGLVYVFFLRKKTKQELEVATQEDPSSLLNRVMKATENLNDQYIIGRGAHGTVYKAHVAPDKDYAVKKILFAGHEESRSSMVTEIIILGTIRHRNLLKLEEFWLREDHGLILYRYMQNGSLHDVLHEIKPPPTLEWSVRYRIALGTAYGLEYLHHDCDPRIVHRDVKPMNILLDSDMEPHVSDFGIAKLLDQSSASTSSAAVVGTTGYIAPENAFIPTRSVESDVYSYGVVLLELITRKKALDPSFGEQTDIVGWARSAWSNAEDIDQIVDSSLPHSNIINQVVDVLMVAFRCTDQNPRQRPTMRDVIKQLLEANPQVRSIRG
ncbi:unnamed protein product [Prunus armeniaca]|uniref:non-specific serine/threonine protein kinase n=1 Tax=Prunus armeniaca TaxID=36596 RepID=A0A6J5UEI4_PRUAR|nr:unnamed protein product [Prunus armeniaca]